MSKESPVTQPYTLRIVNNTHFVHNVQLFNPRYYVDGIDLLSPVETINVKEICAILQWHIKEVYMTRCMVTRHNPSSTSYHGGSWTEDAFLARLEPWVVTKDATGAMVSVPLEFNLSTSREQKNIADSRTNFRLDAVTYLCFYAYPGITYDMHFFIIKK